MTTEDPRIEQARQIIAHALTVSCDLGELTMYVERVDRVLSTPAAPWKIDPATMVQKATLLTPRKPEVPYDDPSRRTEGRRYMPPTGERIKCNHCANDATHADSCPYAEEINNNDNLFHFWCDNPDCEAVVNDEQREAAWDI